MLRKKYICRYNFFVEEEVVIFARTIWNCHMKINSNPKNIYIRGVFYVLMEHLLYSQCKNQSARIVLYFRIKCSCVDRLYYKKEPSFVNIRWFDWLIDFKDVSTRISLFYYLYVHIYISELLFVQFFFLKVHSDTNNLPTHLFNRWDLYIHYHPEPEWTWESGYFILYDKKEVFCTSQISIAGFSPLNAV